MGLSKNLPGGDKAPSAILDKADIRILRDTALLELPGGPKYARGNTFLFGRWWAPEKYVEGVRAAEKMDVHLVQSKILMDAVAGGLKRCHQIVSAGEEAVQAELSRTPKHRIQVISATTSKAGDQILHHQDSGYGPSIASSINEPRSILPKSDLYPLILSQLVAPPVVSSAKIEQALITPSPASNANRLPSGMFNDLPAEILHCLADFLDTLDAASLTLCSRDILKKLGSKHFRALNNAATPEPNPDFPYAKGSWETARRTPFQLLREELVISMLDTQVSDNIYCYYCEKIHHPSKTGSEWGQMGSTSNWRKCSEIEQFRTGTFHIQDGFTYSRIQALMGRHRIGRDYSALMKSLTKTTTMYRENCTIQSTIRPRICGGKFLVRSQHRLLLNTIAPSGNWINLQICAHYFSFQSPMQCQLSRLYALDKIIKCKLSHKDYPRADPCAVCDRLMKCDECCTEFQIDQQEIGRNGELILVFSVWQDFGEGKTPFDPKWVRRFVMFPGEEIAKIEPEPEERRIKEAYEGFDFMEPLTESMERALTIKEAFSPSVQC